MSSVKPAAKLKGLINAGLNTLGYEVKRRHGLEQAAWLREMHIETVLDVGANVGQFAASIRKVLPEARIYAFEPIEESFAVLARKTHKDALIQCFPYALGSEDGSALFNKNDFTPASSLLPLTSTVITEFPNTAKTSEVEIKVRRLDSIAPDLNWSDPLLVKMDVQGFELHVIEGGRETLAQADVVIMEVSFAKLYEGQPSFDELYRELRSLGLHFYGVMEQVYSSRSDLPLYCDALFVRADAF